MNHSSHLKKHEIETAIKLMKFENSISQLEKDIREIKNR